MAQKNDEVTMAALDLSIEERAQLAGPLPVLRDRGPWSWCCFHRGSAKGGQVDYREPVCNRRDRQRAQEQDSEPLSVQYPLCRRA